MRPSQWPPSWRAAAAARARRQPPRRAAARPGRSPSTRRRAARGGACTDLLEAGRAMDGPARLVGREDPARQLVQAAALGLGRELVEQAPAEPQPARCSVDVHGVLANAGVEGPVRVRRDAREAHDASVAVLGRQEGQRVVEPRADLGRVARARLERRLALGDACVVDRGDGRRVAETRRADGHGHRSTSTGLAGLSICTPMATAQATPLSGRTAWARNLAAPVRDFLSTETGSAIVLLAGHDRRPAVGQLAVAGLLRVGVDHGAVAPARGLDAQRRPARVGQRRPHDPLLPGRRPGGQARARPRGAARRASAWRCRSSPALGGMARPGR